MYYYPGASARGGHDGLLVEIRPSQGEPWVGIFAFGNLSPKAVSGIYSLPDPSRLCVIAKGAGYFVSANNPAKWDEVEVVPVMDVRSVLAQDLIVFADFTELTAYNALGVKWQTEQLAFDGFKILEVTDSQLKGEYFDIRNDSMGVFSVDLFNGKAHRGI